MTWLTALVRPKTSTEAARAALLLWNPVIACAVAFASGGARVLAGGTAIVILIADLVVLQCLAGAYALGKCEVAFRRRLGGLERVPSTGSQFFFAGSLIPLALPSAFAAGGVVARMLGMDWGELDSGSYRIGVGFGLVMTTVFFFQRSAAQARESARAAEVRMSELENRRLRAQLAALTAEMNPHLLFNALNTVAALIHRDPDGAEEVVVQLSGLYRGVLRSAQLTTHALEYELRLCDAYLRIEHARFGERLRGEIDIDPAIDVHATRVPVLVLQPFVENAVRHGFSQRVRGGTVRVALRKNGSRIDITVDDDGVGFGQSSHRGEGKAIANCKERLALTYGGRASLEVGARSEGGTRVFVSVPIGDESQAG